MRFSGLALCSLSKVGRRRTAAEKAMSVYINDTWVYQYDNCWVAEAVAFSENGNHVTISSCHDSPELAHKKLIAGMKELRLVPADWDDE